jgi:hypothetical protein
MLHVRYWVFCYVTRMLAIPWNWLLGKLSFHPFERVVLS